MPRSDNIHEIPKDLPVPQDDGACAHLTGMKLPSLALRSTSGRTVDLSKLSDFDRVPLPDAPGSSHT